MLDLFKQFFSFKKLMKDRLVAAFFFLGLVVVVVSFFSALGDAFSAFGDGKFLGGLGLFFAAFFKILFLFVSLRLISELMIAIFHINNNLSPDGGKSDTADIDVFETTREAATKAAKSATSATKSAIEKTKTKLAERNNDDDDYPDYEDTVPPKRRKTAAKKTTARKTVTRKPAAKKPAKRKPATKKAAAKKPTTRKTPPKK